METNNESTESNKNYNIIKDKHDAEYAYIIDERTVWFIDYIIGVAFPTPINYRSKDNGLYNSGLEHKVFPDYLDFQNYLEEITGGQEVSLESLVDPNTNIETNSIIKWATQN